MKKLSTQKGSVGLGIIILGMILTGLLYVSSKKEAAVDPTPATGVISSENLTPLGEGSGTIGVLPFKIKITAADTSPNYIWSKLVAGSNITLTKNNPGANETITIAASGGSASPLTTKGDLYTYSTVDARLPVGTNGKILSADSGEATGLKWITATGTGDMLAATYDPANIAEQLVGLTATQTLTNKDLSSGTNTFPTFNQNTTGSAAKWTTARLLAGNSVDGSANVAFANAFIVQGTSDSGLSGAQFLGALGTGIVKNTTTTGVLSIAVAGDFPTLNQNTTGSAATLTTPRAIYGNNFDGSAALTQIIASTYGGTGNGFTKFSGPATSEKTFTLPNASATILTDNAVVTVAQGGTGLATLTANNLIIGNGTSTPNFLAPSTSGKVAISNGTTFVMSTPTFPNASATSGKFIRSDGTNWIASTPTFPTSAGSAGKILASDGTNYIESTPTFPYSASATSGKIIKSDGTNWVASTETYAAPGTSGNILTSDGTNWTSAAKSFTGLVEAISFQDANTGIANQTYVLELYAEYAYTINEMRIISGAGTVTANLKIGSTSVTSCSAVSVTTTIASCTASGANTVAVGDKITLVLTSASSLDNLQATIKTTR